METSHIQEEKNNAFYDCDFTSSFKKMSISLPSTTMEWTICLRLCSILIVSYDIRCFRSATSSPVSIRLIRLLRKVHEKAFDLRNIPNWVEPNRVEPNSTGSPHPWLSCCKDNIARAVRPMPHAQCWQLWRSKWDFDQTKRRLDDDRTAIRDDIVCIPWQPSQQPWHQGHCGAKQENGKDR
jgi:hypothetical protein